MLRDVKICICRGYFFFLNSSFLLMTQQGYDVDLTTTAEKKIPKEHPGLQAFREREDFVSSFCVLKFHTMKIVFLGNFLADGSQCLLYQVFCGTR